MLQTLNDNHHLPRKQAAIRSRFSTIDHIHVASQLQKKAGEYDIPLCFAFDNYHKAFDSIQFIPPFRPLENQGVDPAYIPLLYDLYDGATSTLKLHRDTVTNSKYRAVTKSKIMEGARNSRSEQGCDINYGNC